MYTSSNTSGQETFLRVLFSLQMSRALPNYDGSPCWFLLFVCERRSFFFFAQLFVFVFCFSFPFSWWSFSFVYLLACPFSHFPYVGICAISKVCFVLFTTFSNSDDGSLLSLSLLSQDRNDACSFDLSWSPRECSGQFFFLVCSFCFLCCPFSWE